MSTFPALDLTRCDLSKLGTDRIAGLARDAAYVGVGFSVLGFQQAQVRRRQLVDTVKDGVDELRGMLG